MMSRHPIILGATLALAVLLVIIATSARLADAQLSGCTNECPLATYTFTPANFQNERIYFSMDVQGLQEFEYRLIANDNRPLRLLEIYDFDEGDQDGINFSCFVVDTVDNTTCPNQYIANGQTMPIILKRNVKWGFKYCPGYNSTDDASQSMTLKAYYRPLLPATTYADQLPMCANFKKEEPAAFCAGAGQVVAVKIALVLLAVVMSCL